MIYPEDPFEDRMVQVPSEMMEESWLEFLEVISPGLF